MSVNVILIIDLLYYIILIKIFEIYLFKIRLTIMSTYVIIYNKKEKGVNYICFMIIQKVKKYIR